MKKRNPAQVVKPLALVGIVLLLGACKSQMTTKQNAYGAYYDVKPTAVVIMPPINRTTNVDAKAYLQTVVGRPFADLGYYVVPPMLSFEMMKQESAYDAELFINANLTKFQEIFGADMAVFTIIHTWEKSYLANSIQIDAEFIVKYIPTNEVIFERRGVMTYDTRSNVQLGGVVGMAVDAVATATAKYVDPSVFLAYEALKYMPRGQYSTFHMKDMEDKIWTQDFKFSYQKGRY